MKPVEENSVPLYVDLDGTLVATDLLWESSLALVRAQPLSLLAAPLWLFRGKAVLKTEIARRVTIDVKNLPYRPEVLEFLKSQRATGRKIVLATASYESFARAVADHLGLFDHVIASGGGVNLKGKKKLERIVSDSNGAQYDYIGDSRADRPIWAGARLAVVVCSERAKGAYQARGDGYQVISHPGTRLRDWARALRPHQWAKNTLLALPLIASHRFTEAPLLFALGLAVLAFSLMASFVYVVNDLLDLQHDRRHRTKKNRPFASGAVPIPVGVLTAVGLLTAAVVLASALPRSFQLLLVLYLVTTTLYSLYLKKKLLVDVICLAGLYSLRVFAGGEAVGIEVSDWLLAFSMFLFFSLALAKRYTELTRSADTSSSKTSGRGYRIDDLDLIRSTGSTSGLIAVLVFSLYIQNAFSASQLYSYPRLLWLICPILLYWISRIWFLASRDQLSDDPVVFALKDRISQLSAVLVALILVAATALSSS
jgi:4-hydroxybenzoate polyprenyltransferase/phosphoserine phosphatase